jgi:nitrogen regulatory protein P-II 1
MTKIEAVIRSSSLEDARRALDHPWVGGITLTEVKSYARGGGPRTIYRGAVSDPGMTPMLRLEVVVPEGMAPRILHDLERALRAGDLGEGRLYARPVDEAVRIRTGERGEGAL